MAWGGDERGKRMKKQPAAAPSQTSEPRSRLARIFAVLAALNIVTAIGALVISQTTLMMLTKQQVDGVSWNERVAEMMTLRDVIALVDSPANAIFQSQDVALERRHLATAEAQFGQTLARVQDRFAPVVEGELRLTPIAQKLQRIDAFAT